MTGDERVRCWGTTNPLYIEYHDEEWGVPVHDDMTLFEFLVLEGFQVGLRWELILRRRDNLRRAFEGFDPEMVARFTKKDVERLLKDHGMIWEPEEDRGHNKQRQKVARGKGGIRLVRHVHMGNIGKSTKYSLLGSNREG